MVLLLIVAECSRSNVLHFSLLDFIRKLFSKIEYSQKGSNNREAEERAFMFFIDYLDECEKGTIIIPGIYQHCINSFITIIRLSATAEATVMNDDSRKVTLEDVLVFFTGADCIPPLGYSPATLYFDHTVIYPVASTCAVTLTLPTMCAEYPKFKKNLDTAFLMHGGFGLL